LSQSNLNSVKLPIPPINEQKEIVDSLSRNTIGIDTVLESAKKQISLLQERKQIIINDVVTGKVKVI
jgi:type I restriction enzyme S subunit